MSSTTGVTPVALAQERRTALGRRAQFLAAASVVYNTGEAVVAIGAGVAASSVALVGFGLDSIVEMSSGLVILWQFRHPMPETRERQALRLIAVSFFALAGYVTFESLRSLAGGEARCALDRRHRARSCVLDRDAVPVLGAAPHRSSARVDDGRRGLKADPALHLPVRRPPSRAADELRSGLVVGGPARRNGRGGTRGEGRPGRVARRRLRVRTPARCH